ncbi:MAG TPA: S24 family peptidase, partial [Terriglobales bacterium]|nr:S24 family peptidase [Terriglobales bacterium]
RVFINGRPHRIISINGHKVTRILPISDSIVIKVSGDSMNKANILNGDYILLRLLPKNVSDFDISDILPEDEDFYKEAKHSQVVTDGDIVAAEVLNEDSEVTLKRFYRRGDKIVLAPDSTNPVHRPKIFDSKNQGFFVRGVAVAVFKPT